MNTRILGTLALLLPLSVLAQGAPPPGGAPPGGAPPAGGMTAQGAMGGDKSIDQTAFFKDLDRNHDGKVTPEEWKAAGLPEPVFSMIDSKKKGYATWQDFEAHPPMSSFDLDHDGKVTLAEMVKAVNEQFKNPPAGGGGPGGPGGPPPNGGTPPKQ